MANLKFINPSKHPRRTESNSFLKANESDSSHENCSNGESIDYHHASDDNHNSKRNTNKSSEVLARKIAIECKVSSSKISNNFHKISEDGIDLPTPSQ